MQPNHSIPSEVDCFCYVYVLIHIELGKVFYVGRATLHNGRFDRYSSHLSEAKYGGTLHVHRKIRSLLDSNQHIKFEIRATGMSMAQAEEIERRLIASYGMDNLTNSTPGGKDIIWLSQPEQAKGRLIPPRTQEQILRHQDGAVNKKTIYIKDRATGEVKRYKSAHDAGRAIKVSTQTVLRGARSGKVISIDNLASFLPFS